MSTFDRAESLSLQEPEKVVETFIAQSKLYQGMFFCEVFNCKLKASRSNLIQCGHDFEEEFLTCDDHSDDTLWHFNDQMGK